MENGIQAKEMREIRTYLSISHPIDPARIFTLTDMDMSYALASTLIEWDDSRQIVSALASRWDIEGHKIRFTLSEDARWSDGKTITSQDVKRSLDRAKRVYGEDLRSLFDSLDGIDCPDPKTVTFILKPEASTAVIMKKLTEPMYGVIAFKDGDELNLRVTSGPYSLEKDLQSETALKRNPFWVNRDDSMAEQVIIRAPKPQTDAQQVLFEDPWPNLMASHSLMPEPLLSRLNQGHFGLWKRSFDRTLILTFYGSKMKEKDSHMFFQFLQKHLDRKVVAGDLTGFSTATQLFPSGSTGFVDSLNCPTEAAELPKAFRGKKLKVLISPDRVSSVLRDNFAKAIQEITGQSPSFIEVPLNKVLDTAKEGNYDFYLGSFGVADPNLEGALSFFFELSLPPIASGEGVQNLSKRTAELRSEKDDSKRLAGQKTLLRDAVCYGSFVPLFHFSTVVIARPEIDLSKVPATDESVSFSKVRFR
jgi:MarR-like DNA-binding transcriptional regulator SgrR of sgrS sRNA